MPIQTLGPETTFPIFLGTSSIGTTTGVGTVWDVGINGEGYLLSTLGEESPYEFRSYAIASIPIQKSRFDASDEPGEQTFEAWWARAQHSWHMGAGQLVFDSPTSTRYAFRSSKGLNPWVDGHITLLKDTASLATPSDNNVWLLADGDYLFYSNDDDVVRIDSLTSPTPVTRTPVASSDIKAITSDGKWVYASVTGNGIYRDEISAFDGFAKVNNLIPDIMGFAKERLICGVGPALHEVDDFTSLTDGATAIYTVIKSNWVWNAITEVSPAIYVSGYAGDKSAIYGISLDSSALSAGLTLGAPRLIWEAPEGEIIYSIKGYLGRMVLIGTSKGVRNGIVSSDAGDLEVSALIVETDYPVRCFTFQEDFAWFGWTRFDSASSGIGRIHLGELTYASDLMYTIQGDTLSVVDFNGKLVFSVVNATTNRIAYEHATDYVASGHFYTGEIRFGTFERKALRFFDALLTGTGGTLDASSSVDDGALTAFLTDAPIGPISETVTMIGSRVELMVTLERGSATVTPTLREWRLRAEPMATGRFRYMVPILLYDRMTALNGRAIGYPGYAWERLSRLMTLYRDGTVFQYEDPSTGRPGGSTPRSVRMEDLQFKSFTPAHGSMSGMGGVGLVTMRDAQ